MSSSYSPSADLCALGERLNESEMPEILFRFPGPCGLFDLSHNQMSRLAPAEVSICYLSVQEYFEFSAGIKTFGSLIVFNPASFQVVKPIDEEVLLPLGFTAEVREKIFLGLNRPVSTKDFAWVPPETYFSSPDLKHCRSPEHVRDLVGDTYENQLEQSFQSVRSYMEEMSEVLRSGISRPNGSWYAVPRDERRLLLEQANIKAIWS